MRKKPLLALILTAVVAPGALLFGGCAGDGTEESGLTAADWMSRLKPEARLVDVVLPGSHDAGSRGMLVLGETQSDTIGAQLEKGVRYFDIRVTVDKDELVIFHGILTGMKFSVVLDEIAAFIEKHPDEFLVLDFQHFENGAQSGTREAIESKLDPARNAVKTDEPLSELTVAAARAKGYKYIVAWGAAEADDRGYIFPRDAALLSPYDQEEHKKGWEHLFQTAFGDYYSRRNPDKFFVLQTVLTMSTKPSDSTYLIAPIVTAEELDEMWDQFYDSLDLERTNIIMRDYITSQPDFLNSIIRLNCEKGLILT